MAIAPSKESRTASGSPPAGRLQPSAAQFHALLADAPLFKNSRWETFLAGLVPYVAGCFPGKLSARSSVVESLTLWEQFLIRRCGRARQMTFSVAFREHSVDPHSYLPHALTALLGQFIEYRVGWQNQPLEVEVAAHRGVVDPRKRVTGEIGVVLVSSSGSVQTCGFDLNEMAGLAEGQRREYVDRQLSFASSRSRPVSIVCDLTSRRKADVAGTFSKFPGAWLRMAPHAESGGIIMSADHLVLDGHLFQNLLLRTAAASRSQRTSSPVACRSELCLLPLEPPGPLCELIADIVLSLDDCGLRLRSGKDSLLLVTIPQTGPEANPQIETYCRRILPLLADMTAMQGAACVRERIRALNQNGWQSLGAHVWNQLYSGALPCWLIRYFECIAPRIPFQNASQYLAGGALLSCLPKVSLPGICASDIALLAAETIPPACSGPALTVMQVPNQQTGQMAAHITLGGSGRWKSRDTLERLKQTIAKRISAQPGNGQRPTKVA